TLINQTRNISHPYLQARAQSTTSSPYAHIQAPGSRFHLDPRCLSSAKLTFMVHIEVHLPNGEDEDDDKPTVQKNAEKTPKASKEASGS
ncbi:hypothetical protein CROQUDRAFT_661347, partial [Cronartium quercuum f. sp. fusiforme G11]